jgi:phenylacetate-CoA ligase
MSDWKLRLYHQMPPFFRNWVASGRGYYLSAWRYGAETERLVAQALERDYWSASQWKTYQENRLSFLLHRAATKVPYYRQHWAKRRQQGDTASWDYLENWPTLEKEPLRANPQAFVAEDCDIKKMFHEHTSGTTGKSLDLWSTRDTVRAWYALFEARWRRWHGVNRQDRWAIMGGQLVTPVEQIAPPFWVWNQGMNQLYFSSYHLAPQFLASYLDALRQYRIKYIYSYTSSVYTLAQEILRLGYQDDLDIKVVLTNAEPLFQHQRETIEQAFKCPVRETYGMSEMVLAAGECAAGSPHLWPDVGHWEFADKDNILPSANGGELICTGLLNADMPLIRYRVGDRVWLSTDDQPCACGRHLPRLQEVEGRQDDMLYTPEGRHVGRLDPVFKSSLPIREAQIIQETLQRVRVLYVPDADFTTADGDSIVQRLHDRMGANVEISLEPVTSIPRTANGKFRAVICQLSQAEKDLISR